MWAVHIAAVTPRDVTAHDGAGSAPSIHFLECPPGIGDDIKAEQCLRGEGQVFPGHVDSISQSQYPLLGLPPTQTPSSLEEISQVDF